MSAMRVLNMANTFYTLDLPLDGDDANDLDDNNSVSGTNSRGKGGMGEISKRYLQAEDRLKHHPIWRKQGFWETALKEGLFVEMEKLKPSHSWDELSPEGLRETVISIHNLVFGQLGTLSFTMREQGSIDKKDVAANVLAMSRKFQLCEDQEYELLVSITGQTIKEYTPPPIIPNAPMDSAAGVGGTAGDDIAVGTATVLRESVLGTQTANRDRTHSNSSTHDSRPRSSSMELQQTQSQSRRTSKTVLATTSSTANGDTAVPVVNATIVHAAPSSVHSPSSVPISGQRTSTTQRAFAFMQQLAESASTSGSRHTHDDYSADL